MHACGLHRRGDRRHQQQRCDPTARCHTLARTDALGLLLAGADPYPGANALHNPATDTDAKPDAYVDTNANAYPDPQAHTNPNTNPNTDADSQADANTNAYPQADANTDADPQTNADPDAKSHADDRVAAYPR